MSIAQSITGLHICSRKVYFKQNKFSFASEQTTKVNLTENSTTNF